MTRLMFWSRSLQSRLTVFNVVAVALGLAIVCVSVLAFEYRAIREDQRSELGSIGMIIADNLQAPLVLGDVAAATDALDALDTLEDDIDGCVVGPDGVLFASNPDDGTWEDRLVADIEVDGIAGRQLHVQDVLVSGDVVGRLYLIAGLERFYSYMRRILAFVSVLFVGALALSGMVARKAVLTVTLPLRNLRAGTRDIIASRDYSLRVSRISNDELGDLTDHFNTMLDQVEARDMALVRSHEELETRVVERTRDLEIEVAERKKAEDSMRRAKDDAELANHAKSEFLANMSHELRTPLHGILSFAQFGLREAPPGDDANLHELFDNIKGSGETLLVLLNDLLDLAKLEAGRMTFDMDEHVVQDLLEAGVAEFDSYVSGQNIHVGLVGDVGDLVATLDPMRFMQVLRNLLSNAVKFSPEDGRVTVEATATADVLTVEISDEGMGVPADEREAIFDKFIQSSQTKTGAGGTGLGLAITREIVEAHGGTVSAHEAPGGGALFRVTIPLVGAAVPVS